MTATADFERERQRLFGIAYRMLGVVQDAEDVVQEAWLRYQRAVDVDTPEAYLTTITTRLAIDRLRSARRQRESYVGAWLPEPIVTDHDPAHVVELDESVTLGFLHVLERLGPVERAVFLLHDVFGLAFAEIAEMVGRPDATCRQIARRARDRVRGEPLARPVPAASADVLERLRRALHAGDATEVARLVAPDVVVVSDGGPTTHAARRPVVGVERVTRLLTNLVDRLPEDVETVTIQANGSAGLLLHVGGVAGVLVEAETEPAGERIVRLHIVTAPDKLRAAAAALGLTTAPE